MEKRNVKKAIIKSAWELFREKGYENTTVDDIINRSETSKGSFYYYFTSKDALLDTLSDIFDEEYKKLAKKLDKEMDSMDKLLSLNYDTALFIEKKINIEQLSFLYSTQLVTRNHRRLLDQNRYYYRIIADIVEEGQKRSQIIKEKSVREIVHYYAMCERSLIYDWCLYSGEYSLSEYSKETMAYMMEHFRTVRKE